MYQCFVATGPVNQFLFSPVQKAFALVIEVCLERPCLLGFVQHNFFFAYDIEVHQGKADPRQAQLLAQQPAVNSDLCPVELTMIIRHHAEFAPKRFDFFQLIQGWIKPIGSSTNKQVLILAAETDFHLILRGAARGDNLVSGHAFLRRRCRGET